ncbi:hypothetical protein [Lacimicrobium sp. SS2-24]|uniref:hypothetical protein n=1 Tax=Lacimicrobium sp. SS2-24 TaxID=2005569 RepID=UPI000B4B7232|nr:hypothetical protein [Lacimicrobium sp. SS2-24]
MLQLTTKDWISLATHLKKWITNLRRARAQRKTQSKQALRNVIKATRETTLYLRSVREGGQTSFERESELAILWTELSFELEDLNLIALADKCRIKGRYWADPEQSGDELQDKANIRLDDAEKQAVAILREIRDDRGIAKR